jgi:hypothetical protein
MGALELVEGWTGNVDYALKADGELVDLTAMSLQLVLKDSALTVVSVTGTVSIFSASSGGVTFVPASGDLLASSSPYSARFKVTDSGGKTVFFPSSHPEKWLVHRQ